MPTMYQRNNDCAPALRRFKKLKTEIEARQNELEQIKDSIKFYMRTTGQKEMTVSRIKVIYSKVLTPVLDKKGLENDLPEVYRDYTTDKVVERIIIN